MKNTIKILVTIGVFSVYGLNMTYSQWNAVYDNQQHYIGDFPMSYFNIRTGSFFEMPYQTIPFRLLVNTGPGTERLMYYAYGNTWNTHSTANFYNYWTPNTGDRYYTVGSYNYPAPIGAPLTNLLLAIGSTSSKVLAAPYDQNDTWEQIWSNNGSNYLGDPAWDVYIPTCRFMPGNFYTLNNPLYNSTGKQVFAWDNDGFAALLQFNFDYATYTG